MLTSAPKALIIQPPGFRTTYRRSRRRCFKRSRSTILTLLAIVVVLWLYSYHPRLTTPSIARAKPPRIAKATIMYERSNAQFLELHAAYDEKWGLETHILRSPIVRGWKNEFLFLTRVVMLELEKDVEEQVHAFPCTPPSLSTSR
jgi:hypothetical protein